MPADAESRKPAARSLIAGALLLCGVTALAYLPALRAGFIWDDRQLLTDNPLIKSWSGLGKIWFTTESADYWPVTLTAFWLQWRLWGMHALGYHAVNLSLHLAEALMLWGLLRRLRVPGAYVAAFIFAVHPVNVETVAWISELKNLMAMFWFLAAIWFFLRDAGGAGSYALSLLCFILGMLSKGSVAVLPLILLGLIAWRRRPRRKDLARILPFLLVAGILALTDIWFQKHGTAEVFRRAGILERLLGAGAAVWFYLGHALWPAHLTFVYPSWHIRPADPRWWLPLLAAIGVSLALARSRHSQARPARYAWGYFCLCLAPALGFTDVYFMRYALVADRYEHLALIGVIAFAAARWARWHQTWHGLEARAMFPTFVASAVILALCLLTHRQAENYRDTRTLFLANLRANPHSWLANNYLGSTPPAVNTPTGMAYVAAALRDNPGYAEAHYNLGVALAVAGRNPEAIAQYEVALRLRPNFADARNNLAGAHYNLGISLARAGRLDEAVAQYEMALQFRPGLADAHNNLGEIFLRLGRNAEAVGQFEEALRGNPRSFQAENNLGTAFMRTPDRLSEAIAHYEAAARLNPRDGSIQANLGFALASAGRLPEAIARDEAALRLLPDYAAVHDNLGQALLAAGRASEARTQFDEAARLRAIQPAGPAGRLQGPSP